MRVLAVALAVVLMFVVMVDAFEALVLPRRAMRRYRPARIFYRTAWATWRFLADTLLRGAMRQHFFSWFGPFSLLTLFAWWTAILIFSFALLHWAIALPLGSSVEPPPFVACLYLSGETFFTLGYGDISPTSWIGRLFSVMESGVGFGFMAIVIGYLPVLYQAFSRRERDIALLDARAGSPPTAGEMLRRLGATNSIDQIEPLLLEWERWAAELLESQLSFPVLGFYRSQHDNQNWLAGLAAILDTCAILLSNFPDMNRYQVQITFAMARHAAVDLTLIYRTPKPAKAPERLSSERYHRFLTELHGTGLRIDCSEASFARLGELREMYEPFLTALSLYFEFRVPAVIAEDVPVDNWQRSPWQEKSPGIGKLPAIRPEEHFV
ncbi:MAG: ion channel [Pirellulales bacterium]